MRYRNVAERPTFEEFRDKALARPKVRAEYDALSAAFEMKRRTIAMRKAAGLDLFTGR